MSNQNQNNNQCPNNKAQNSQNRSPNNPQSNSQNSKNSKNSKQEIPDYGAQSKNQKPEMRKEQNEQF